MRKCLLFCSGAILFIIVVLFIYFNIFVNFNVDKNREIINFFNDIFLFDNLDISLEYDSNLPKVYVDGNDYVGVINIGDLFLPVESECDNNFLDISYVCSYYNKSFIIMGTNLRDSFSSYKLYNVDDFVMFTNTLGYTFRYKISDIKRIDRLDGFIQYDGDLIIVINNYYDMEYVLFICEFY